MFAAGGVVFGAGAVGTNELLADCKHRDSLPRISDRLGHLVRTNSEEVLAVVLPKDLETFRDVTFATQMIEGRSLGLGLQAQGPNHRKLRPALR